MAPRVWITNYFMTLDVDKKKSFLDVVYAYYAGKRADFGDDELDFIRLKSSTTGKNVGTYNPFTGLDLVYWLDL